MCRRGREGEVGMSICTYPFPRGQTLTLGRWPRRLTRALRPQPGPCGGAPLSGGSAKLAPGDGPGRRGNVLPLTRGHWRAQAHWTGTGTFLCTDTGAPAFFFFSC